MIRNVKITLGRLCLLFISIIGIYFFNNVIAAESFVVTGASDVWYDLTTYQGEVNVEYNNFSSTSTLSVDQYGNFLTNSVYNAFEFNSTPISILYWDKNGDISFIYKRKIVTNSGWCYNSSFVKVPTNCGNYGYTINEIKDLKQGSIVKYAILSEGALSPGTWFEDRSMMYFCFYTDSNESLCVRSGIPSNFSDNAQLVASCGVEDGCSAGVYESVYGNSPFYSGGGSIGGGSSVSIDQANLSNTIYYYETRFGWDQNMCYVGTNDLTSVYGTSGIDFNYGTGNTIFGLFNSIYNGFGDNIIQNVGRFVNTWLINYSQWFATAPGNRLYLANYPGPGSNVNLYYTGLTFPFANNPAAIYFMSDLLYNQYSVESTQGEEMAYYCYLKLNRQSIENGDIDFKDVQDKVTTGIVQRIETYNSEVLSGRVGFLVPDLTGSSWGEVFSGDVFTGDVDPSSTFENMYNGVLSLFNKGDYSGNGVLPDWIIYPMLFLILFRIMKH